MRSYHTFPPLPLRQNRNGKGGKVSAPLGRSAAAGLIEIVKGGPRRPPFTLSPALRLRFAAAGGADIPFFLISTVLPQWRYISVALFLKSPSAGVTRYPCPVEPGLSSWTAFRPAHATVCFTRLSILQERRGIVNG